MTGPVRVRFAPSPTGHLHVGGARTAIFNWLFARRHGGAFLLRIEDTDQARSTRESEEMVLEDLRWLGLQWDEDFFRQSERIDVYRRAADELLRGSVAYRCYCSEAELERKRQQAEADGRPPHYDLKCYRNPPENPTGPFAVRFHVPDDGDVTIQDHIRGEVTWRKESLGDFIILRSDGMPTYNFCVVVDDHDMRISHVIRAEEHLTNTHRQVLIYRAFDWPVPEFAHVSLILGQDRSKLSKRHGATSVAAYADDGYLPEAMFNYLTLLGWSPPDGKEIFSRDEAAREFSFDRVNAAPAVFDTQKLNWMNSQYIQAAPASRLREMLFPDLTDDAARAWYDDAIDLVKKGASRVIDIPGALRLFFEFDPAVPDPDSVPIVKALAEELRRNGAPRDSESYHALAERLKTSTGVKGKSLFMPIRAAITGTIHGPELHRVVPLLQRGSEIPALGRIMSPLERVEAVLERVRA